MKNIVLLGGGYGNMRIMSRILPNALPEGYRLTLIDRMPFHGLKPEFYALAAGTKSDKDVRMSFPNDANINTVYGEINDINLDEQIISVGNSKVDYDELVIGLGCEDKYHNVPGADTYTHSIQTLSKARDTFHSISELPKGAKVAIVGAGLSGIELASELRESRADLEILLYDRGPRILRNFPEKLSNYISKWFSKHDVTVVPNSVIDKVEPADVMKKQWNNEPLPEKMPELKVQGFLGSLGDKQGFAYIMDRTVTGRLASILKSGVLWLYKYHNG